MQDNFPNIIKGMRRRRDSRDGNRMGWWKAYKSCRSGTRCDAELPETHKGAVQDTQRRVQPVAPKIEGHCSRSEAISHTGRTEMGIALSALLVMTACLDALHQKGAARLRPRPDRWVCADRRRGAELWPDRQRD